MSWGSIISRGAAGGASITMARYVSRRMPSSPPSGRGFPPLSLWPSSAPLVFPKVSSRGALPVRPERHVPTSIATVYELLARALLHGCPVMRVGGHGASRDSYDTVVLVRPPVPAAPGDGGDPHAHEADAQ